MCSTPILFGGDMCPKCKKENTSEFQLTLSTAAGFIPFRDSLGRLHKHDGNYITEVWRCMECNVLWEKEGKPDPCPTCGEEENWVGSHLNPNGKEIRVEN